MDIVLDAVRGTGGDADVSAVPAPILKAPFPAFGGKGQIVDLVWARIGDVRNWIEPFAFSGVMTLRRPHPGKIETINDLNAYVPNFWRAVLRDPDAVAEHADWPVSEADLHARHRWLVYSDQAVNALTRVKEDPDFYDVRIAGWWCWGACCWIGSGWCDATHRNSGADQRPDLDTGQLVTALSQQVIHLGDAGQAINSPIADKRPQLCNGNVTEKRPHIARADSGSVHGAGVHGALTQQIPHMDPTRGVIGTDQRPQLADAFSRGRGVNGNDGADTCNRRRAWLTEWFRRLADRLRTVRVCCGHWSRVCDSPSTLTRLGTTGVFLDPPYRKTVNGERNRSASIYANDNIQCVDSLCDEVQEWCLKWGGDPEIRIVLCGLEGEYPKLESAGWEVVPWKSRGGYGNRTERGKENAARERLWISPHCLKVVPRQQSLFAARD